VAALAFGAAASGTEPLARTAAPFDAQRVSADAWGGVIAYSQFDASSRMYGLAVIRGGVRDVLSVAAQPVPFELDVGPGPDGKPAVVYTRCRIGAGETFTTGFDLYRYSFATATEAPIAGANTSSEEVAPSIWKDRIARANALDVASSRRAPTRLHAPA
jgi:hypothetical protein